MAHKIVFAKTAVTYNVYENYMTCSYYALDLLTKMHSVDEECVKIVSAEIRNNLILVKDELLDLRSGYPHLIDTVDTNHCKYYVLRQHAKHYHKLEATG